MKLLNFNNLFLFLFLHGTLNSITLWGAIRERAQIEPCRLFLVNSSQPLTLLSDEQLNNFYKGIIDRLLQTMPSNPNPKKSKEPYYFLEQQASSLNLGIRGKALTRTLKQSDFLTSIISLFYTLSIKQAPAKPLVNSWLAGQIKKIFGDTSLLNMSKDIKNELGKSLLFYISIIHHHFSLNHRELQSLGLKQILRTMGATEHQLNSAEFLTEISKINLEKYLTHLKKEFLNITPKEARDNHSDQIIEIETFAFSIQKKHLTLDKWIISPALVDLFFTPIPLTYFNSEKSTFEQIFEQYSLQPKQLNIVFKTNNDAPKSESIINLGNLREENPYAFLFPNANSSKLNQHRLISSEGPFTRPLDLILTPSDYMILLKEIQAHLVIVEKNIEQRSFTDFIALTFGAPSFQLFYPGLVQNITATE